LSSEASFDIPIYLLYVSILCCFLDLKKASSELETDVHLCVHDKSAKHSNNLDGLLLRPTALGLLMILGGKVSVKKTKETNLNDRKHTGTHSGQTHHKI
jgi:hypothetical protein